MDKGVQESERELLNRGYRLMWECTEGDVNVRAFRKVGSGSGRWAFQTWGKEGECLECRGRGRVFKTEGFFTVEEECPVCEGDPDYVSGALQVLEIESWRLKRIAVEFTSESTSRVVMTRGECTRMQIKAFVVGGLAYAALLLIVLIFS